MAGRWFDDWHVGDVITHEIRRTVTETGDTLRADTEVIALKESRSRPEAGIVTFQHRALNQRDEVVCQCLRSALIKRKPA